MPKNKFAKIVSETRHKRGISQKQAALELGISQALLSHYENGLRECNLDFLMKAADYYGVSCDYLLGHSTSKSSRTPAAQRQKTLVRTMETIMLLIERTDDEVLRKTCLQYLKTALYRILKLFDGICSDLDFQTDDLSISEAMAIGEQNFSKSYRRALDLKDIEIPISLGSLEYLSNLISEIEGEIMRQEYKNDLL